MKNLKMIRGGVLGVLLVSAEAAMACAPTHPIVLDAPASGEDIGADATEVTLRWHIDSMRVPEWKVDVWNATDGEVLFDNARGIFFNSYPSYVGEAYGAPQLTFRNSTLCQTYDYPSHAGGQNDALVIGGNGWRGRMVVEGDSVVTGKFVMAAWSAAAQGSIIQKGGEVVVCGTTNDNNNASDLATSGHGYYELRSGTAKFLGYNRIGGYGSMVVAQYGGTFALTNYPGMSGAFFNAPAGGGGKSHLYVRSGTFRVVGNLLLGRYGESALTLDGPDARYSAQNDCVSWGYSDTVSSVNVNDGATLQANFGSRFTKGEYLGKYNYVPKMYLNVNGGRVRFTGDGGGRGGGAFGRVFEDCTDAQNPGITRVTVYEKGLVYEAPSSTANLLHPVLKPTGKGIVRIPWTPVSGLSVSPYVTITGDGTGAAAFAEFDSDTGTITGIRIVSRGCDYTWAKAKVLVGMNGAKSSAPSNEWLEIDCELEENDRLPPGGFAKEGEGTLVLHATNTYEGVTAVNGGVLQLAADDVISAKSELSLGGGTLKLENLHQTFAGLRGTGGTVTGGDLKIVPPNGVWEISAKRFIDRESSAVAGTLDLTAVTEIRIVDTELLDTDAEALRSLNLFSATTVVWPDSLTITGPDGWRLVRKPNALGFGYAKGTMLLVR